MNKIVNYGDRFSQPYSPVPSVCIDPAPEVPNQDKELLDMIYGVDPVTGLPCGDLAVFLSKDANPEVKSYIENRLLSPNPNLSGADFSQEILNRFKGEITDDDIAFFSRNHNESKEEFQDRMKLYMLDQKKKVRDERERKELRQALKKAKGDN